MMETTQRKLTFAFLALLLILAGCKAESPTAPPPVGTGPTPGGGGVTPPTNAVIVLAVSNPNPVVNSTSVITATVTVDGQPVPNGTAVQFSTTLGTFTDTGGTTTLKITTNGVATATVTSGTPGTATITATVNNVSRSTTVTFSAQPVGPPPPPSTTPTIASITPATGRPEGGEQITITGTNFREPVRVLFDPGSGQTPKEGFVASVTPTQIVVLSPRVDLGTGQTLPTDIIVIIEAGTPTEQRVVKAAGFTFQAAVLTPVVRALQPTSGPISGGTRVTIIGDAFQTPVQVFFGAAEAQVISVNFNQIVVMSPRASDTSPDGSGVVTGPVDIKVVNVNSNTSVTFPGGFRYTPKMQITTAGPTEGPFTGGTRVTIDGIGFDDPLAVVTAGVAAQVIRVSGSQIIAITSAVQPTGCANVTGPIVVTNTENGDSATGPGFIFRVPLPVITNISNPNNLGGTATVTVLNGQGLARFTIGGVQTNVTARTDNPDGTTTFTIQIPTTVRLQTLACPAGGAAPQPTAFDVVFTSLLTGCTTTAPSGITVNPAAAPVLFVNPPAFAPFSATITPATIGPPPVAARVTPSPSQTVNVINTGTTTLTITAITQIDGTPLGCSRFSVVTPAIPPNIDLGQCEALPIIVRYNGQTVSATDTCTVRIDTNAGSRSLLLIGTSQ
jgi:hypothetical protein